MSHTLAVARSLDHMTGRKTDGENVDVWTRSTVVFRKEGAWKVMHVHSSVPFYMDGKADWRNTGCSPTFDLWEYIPRLRAEGGSDESLNHADCNAHCDRPGKHQR